MAYIKKEVIDEIRSNANIVDIVKDYLTVTKRGKLYFAPCPFHGGGKERTPSLEIKEDTQIYYCFACKSTGNVFTFLMNIENVGFLEAVSMVAKKIGYNLKLDNVTSAYAEKNKADLDILELAKKYYLNNIFTVDGKNAREYLAKRGINEAIIREFNLGFAGTDKDTLYKLLSKKNIKAEKLDELGLITINGENIYDFFTNRIMIPIENLQGQVVGFTGRIFNGEENVSKYQNTKATNLFEKGTLLFNYHNARNYIREERQVIVVEGNMDAIKMSASGIKNVVALQGVALSNSQIETLKKLNVPVVLMLDNDSAGLDATDKNGKLLLDSGLKTLVVRLSGAKDPDEYIEKYGVEALKNNIIHAIEYKDFVLDYLANSKNLEAIEDQKNYINEVFLRLSHEDDLTKELIMSKISKDYQINIDTLRKIVATSDNKKTTKEKKKEEKVVSKPRMLDKYHLAVSKIIYYMLNDAKYITIFQNRLGYLKEKEERIVASEIIYYYNTNKSINIADFISYIIDNNEAYEFILKCISQNNNMEINEEEFNLCIDCVLSILKKDEIKNLKEEITKEMDINKKIALIAKLTEIKKEV